MASRMRWLPLAMPNDAAMMPAVGKFVKLSRIHDAPGGFFAVAGR